MSILDVEYPICYVKINDMPLIMGLFSLRNPNYLYGDIWPISLVNQLTCWLILLKFKAFEKFLLSY